ncbi:MAG: BamA/TamA family outer membrane protein [Bacteroidales bacterium]|nr:BamA/TamA family outer membrane protein [Bacteroidales bacterium]
MPSRSLVFITLLVLLLSSCSSTKILKENQYMLVKNTVTMQDVKGEEFSDMVNYVQPLPNNKFMGIFNMKTSLYAEAQPKTDRKTDELKDSKFRRWLRESVGEAPVLLDSSMISKSEDRLKTVMKKKGFFHAQVSSEVVFPRKKKAQVNYFVKANDPYYVRRVNMNVPIYEFRKIFVLNMRETYIKRNTRYDEDLISDEIDRMVKLLRNEGYYRVNSSMFYCEVDTIDAIHNLNEKGYKTLLLTFVMDTTDAQAVEKSLYRYYFDDVSVHTNYKPAYAESMEYDTTVFYSFRLKSDSTHYSFITPKVKNRYRKNGKLKKDFKYRTITDKIYSKKGTMYSEDLYSRSKKGLSDLNNFNTIEIVFSEDLSKKDTVGKIGYLDSEYKLVRRKVHSIGGQVDVRSDKSGLSFTYGNKNLFKGAENFTSNIYGSYFYYSKLYRYPEFGASVKLDFPRLFLFKHFENPNALKYYTSVIIGTTYSGLYERWMFNASYSYTIQPNIYMQHEIVPVEFRTVNADESRGLLYWEYYTQSYERRFNKFFLLSLKYTFNYVVPFKKYKQKNNMRFTFAFESSGMLLTGLNALFSPHQRWTMGKYEYVSYEGLEFTFRYNRTINDNNSFAMRLNAGCKLPIGSDSVIPYEIGYYLGGSNSMRGFPFRGVGLGAYYGGHRVEYTGDVKFELNLEYRGTIYKAFKYGVFVDAGNVWMAHKYDGMTNAEFNFKRFYKELAVCAGVGIRLDFNFFIIRLDYAVPFYDPRLEFAGPWINKQWVEGKSKNDKLWYWAQGFKFAIGHAF